ncbi:DUF4959 domain-containing protein [Mariniflexile sp. AS56]|uniref:DUF4959 domain-containing protein n=1 Tax=Mariniflexile sp. AS56 TaxID=3063957 RepID=UPI0026EC1CCD|nr:DUF4959 domain-containing protein [Mariniflexile sp. AS56]MDO7171591.1 DUF4959 domain-containing protein [Mariniflexile sp. AS56]
MKNLKLFILSFCMATTIWSCDEDTVRPLIIDDGMAPGSVISVTVENFPGGSKLSYNLPNDSDLLYVAAEFNRRENSEVSVVKSSVFSNSLIVEGFAEEKAYEVRLYSVDQSENRSEPVLVTINPEKAPIDYVCESMEAFPDFGGIHLFWENPFEGLVSIEISAIDEYGLPQLQDVFYTESLEGDFAVRGFDTSERDFIVIVKDRFGNVSKTKTYTLSPLFEALLERTNYQAIYQKHDTPDAYGWVLSRVIDGSIGKNNGFHSGPGWTDDLGELPEYLGQNVHMFTIDLGVNVKLSRIKWFDRTDYEFRHGNPRLYDIWGTDTLNEEGTLEGWTLLTENGEVIKPSGDPGYGVKTAADIETSKQGWDAVANSSAPPVRFIRFVNKQNWLGSTFVHMSELEAYGQIIN